MNEKVSALSRDQVYRLNRLKKGEKMYTAVVAVLVIIKLMDIYFEWAVRWEEVGVIFWVTVTFATVFSAIADYYGKKLYNALICGESREICCKYADKRRNRYILYGLVPGTMLVLCFVCMFSGGILYDFYKNYLDNTMLMFVVFAGQAIGHVQRNGIINELIDIFAG